MTTELAITKQDEATKSALTIPLGGPGLRIFGGRVDEEWLFDLKGDRAIKVYKEMGDNEPVVAAALLMIQMVMRGVSWNVEGEDESLVVFVSSCKDDLDQSWDDFIDEALSFLQFGWAYHEVIYKLRRPGSSDYNDGKLGWARIPLLGQETRDKWATDRDTGQILGMLQRVDWSSQLDGAFIPVEKAVLFRTSRRKNNPEGRSVLRAAYRPYYFKKNIETFEGIGIERELAGYPVIQVPPEVLAEEPGPEYRGLAERLQKLVNEIRRDEREGAVVPNEESGYKLELLSSGGSRQIDIDPVVARKSKEIMLAMMTDFMLLGHENVGSFALASSKTGAFITAMNAWIEVLEQTINTQLVEPLIRYNGMEPADPTDMPKMKAGKVNLRDVTEVIEALSKMASTGMVRGLTPELLNHMLLNLGLDAVEDEEQLDLMMNGRLRGVDPDQLIDPFRSGI